MTKRPDLTDAELRELALQIRAGSVFTDRSIREAELEQMMPMIFMPLGLMSKEELARLIEDEPYMLYEHISAAGPRSMNGYPMFFSFRYLRKSEVERLQACCDRLDRLMREGE